jgi:predicted SAM-dependent methyltransferase
MENFIASQVGAALTEDNLRRSRLLNVGCGANFHADWVNVDVVPAAPAVIAVDLRRELPFPAQSFDAVYCSHVLEHLDRNEAQALLGRIHALLRPGGILRVVVPDLEAIARLYLELLAGLKREPGARETDYDWIMLEMYDQTVRRVSGGEMARYLSDPGLSNAEFVRSRIGAEAEQYWRPATGTAPRRSGGLRRLLSQGRMRLVGVMARLLGGRAAGEGYAEGLFRQSGEVHRWMYDAYSLGRNLRHAGFASATRQTAFESRIAGFAGYLLDVDGSGRVRKPDSLFMEAERKA